MSLLLNVIFASHARSTHHKLALDALTHLQGAYAARWMNVILCHHTAYLEGAKAPDDDFKDFKNHVLHVRENYWGGAVSSATHWYGQLIDHLRAAEWKEAAYAAGVFSHYYSDPLMPFHTGQSESEGAVHRAAEWSVTKSYEKLREMITNELGGYPQIRIPATPDWLGEMVRAGARLSNQYYEVLIDHYNLAVGVKNPPAGLDRVAQEAVARCLAHATIGLTRILERAFVESAASPPEVTLTMQAVLATINVLIRQIVNKLSDARDRQTVEAIYQEVQATGKAIHSLPESEKLVRQFHAAEVLRIPLNQLDAEPARPAGQKFAQASPADGEARKNISRPMPAEPSPATVPPVIAPGAVALAEVLPEPELPPAPPESADMPEPNSSSEQKPFEDSPGFSAQRASRCYLTLEAPIVDAPSIGPKTAARFHEIGMRTVASLLNSDPVEIARKLNTPHITADVLRDWQAQSGLMVAVAGLRGHDAQLLVAADVRDRATLDASRADELFAAVAAVADSAAGRRILRDSAKPDIEEVNFWIRAARNSGLSTVLRAG